MAPPLTSARARASASHLPPVRKIGSIDFRLNRRTVVDGYGAGPPEKAVGSYRGVLRRGGKRDFSPYLNRGLGESHSTQYARKVCGPCLVDTKAGNTVLLSTTSEKSKIHGFWVNTKYSTLYYCIFHFFGKKYQ